MDLVLRERHVKVIIEIAAVGRYPVKAPTHALLIGANLGERSPRDRNDPHVMMLQMPCGPVDVLSLERASGAGRLPFGRKHQMMHDQLAAAAEQLGQRAASTRGIEHVALLYSQPRQGTTFCSE